MDRRLVLIGATAALSLAVLAGCASVGRSAWAFEYVPENLIFNPDRTGIPLRAIPRSDWPSTVAYSHPRETIEYRETVHDLQGLSQGGRDYLIRRFHSVRTGRMRR